jgi:hypothetical protein
VYEYVIRATFVNTGHIDVIWCQDFVGVAGLASAGRSRVFPGPVASNPPSRKIATGGGLMRAGRRRRMTIERQDKPDYTRRLFRQQVGISVFRAKQR